MPVKPGHNATDKPLPDRNLRWLPLLRKPTGSLRSYGELHSVQFLLRLVNGLIGQFAAELRNGGYALVVQALMRETSKPTTYENQN